MLSLRMDYVTCAKNATVQCRRPVNFGLFRRDKCALDAKRGRRVLSAPRLIDAAVPKRNTGCSGPGIGTRTARRAKLRSETKAHFRHPLIRAAAMSDANATVLVIDDDPDVRASVGRLLRSLGINVQLFATIADFLGSNPPDGPTCLVLDVRLPGQSGLDLQRELARAKRELPIIFITGHGDIPMSVQAMKGGAIEFLTKPFRDQDLLDAIQLGLSRDRSRREDEKDLAALRERFASLSPREREIVIQVARGRLSKQIAHDIGIAEATVKVHRSRAMQKMKAGSLPELGRMADKLKLVPDKPQRV
jgi:FixJ family two-component response regulator